MPVKDCKIFYRDEPGYRILDLRREGVDCIPALGFSDFRSFRHSIEPHCHLGCMEFTLCLKGNLTFELQGKDFPFMPGQVFVAAPHEEHHLRTHPSGLKVFWFLFKIPRAGQRILGLDAKGSKWLSRCLTHLPKRIFAATPSVRESFERLFDVYDTVGSRSPARQVKLTAATLDLLISLVEAARRAPGKATERMLAIARRIQDAPNAEYPIEQLAREYGVSVSTFATEFKRSMGLPLHAYLLNCRIDLAKQLLRSKRTVAAIGQELRFYSTQHFAKTFKRITGVNPQEFRNAGRTNKLSPEALHRPATSR